MFYYGLAGVNRSFINLMDVKLENSVLLLYTFEILVSISYVCWSRPPALLFLMQSGGPSHAAAQPLAPECSPDQQDQGQLRSSWRRMLI